MDFDAREATIDSVHHALFSGLATCRDITTAFLARIESLNHSVNAIIALNKDALSTADLLDRRLREGDGKGPLFGVPILLKDCFDTWDMPTTGANLAMAKSQPTTDAPVVRALRDAGAVILGKTNLHELALEGLSVSSLGGQTLNPYDMTRTPGGSSGGSGAAVAASFAVFATGSDTVNSLRSPASANSLVSVRPTRGLITRRGIIPVTYTQDAIGPIARSVRDAAIALTVMASLGFDEQDKATALVPNGFRKLDYVTELSTGTLDGLRVGIVEGFFDRTDSKETQPVNEAANVMISVLRAAGATTVPITDTAYNSPTIIESSDVQKHEYREMLQSYLQRPDLKGVHPHTPAELYGGSKFLVIPVQYNHVKTALASSTSDSSYEAVKQNIENLTSTLRATFDDNRLDCLIYPEQANLVKPVGSPSQSGRNGILATVTGSPVVCIPMGFSPATETAPVGIPIGLEILGRPYTEGKLLQIAYQIEQRARIRRPPAAIDRFIESSSLKQVPSVVPDTSNIPKTYKIGRLS